MPSLHATSPRILGPLLAAHRLPGAATPEELRHAIGSRIVPHRLEVLRRPTGPGEVRCTELGGLRILYIRYGADVLIEPAALDDCYLVDIPLAGRSWMRDAGMNVPIRPGMVGITSPGMSATYLQEADCELVTVRIDRRALDAELARQLGAPAPSRLTFGTAASLDSGAGRALVGALVAVCAQLSDADSPLARGLTQAETGRWLLSTLLACLPHNYAAALGRRREATPLPHYLLTAERVIAERLALGVDVDTLVAATGMSRRTLFAGYRRWFDTTPMERIRQRRLEAVRRELLAADPRTATVTGIALAWGFGNLGNFAMAYRRAFDESPSATLRRPPV